MDFLKEVYSSGQHIELYGVGAHHQNSISEHCIQTIVESARMMLLHSRRLWPEAISQAFWPLALSYAVYVYNHLHHDSEGKTPAEKYTKSTTPFDIANIYTFGCPGYILDHHLQNGGYEYW